MKRLALALALMCGPLAALPNVSPYLGVSAGASGENVGSVEKLFAYLVPAKIPEMAEVADHAVYQDFRVEVSTQEKLGPRVNAIVGAMVGNVYKVECEFSACQNRILVKHDCPDLQKCDTSTTSRATISGMVNVGGYFPGKLSARPYSMIGIGAQIFRDSGVSSYTTFAYQWITGVESPLANGVSSYVHHRYRKSLRSRSMHSVEFGLKFSA